jgi:hypothetical protein
MKAYKRNVQKINFFQNRTINENKNSMLKTFFKLKKSVFSINTNF